MSTAKRHGFWRRLFGAQPDSEQDRPMSPIEIYEAGGGDLSSVSPGTAALLAEAERGHHKRQDPHQHTRRHEIREPRTLDHTAPATLTQYLLWLDGFIKKGGRPSHYYDYPFANARLTYALGDVMVDSGAEYGAFSRHIIVPCGLDARCTNPSASFNGWGHTDLFFMDGYRTNSLEVPVYSDPEFESILTEQCREERKRQLAEQQALLARLHKPSRRQAAGSNDEAVLRMLGGATFGPDASLILPSGQRLDADEAQVFTSLYADNPDECDGGDHQ